MFDAVAYSTGVGVGYDSALAYEWGVVDTVCQEVAEVEPGGVEGNRGTTGIYIEAGGKATSTFFDVKAGDGWGVQEGADG